MTGSGDRETGREGERGGEWREDGEELMGREGRERVE